MWERPWVACEGLLLLLLLLLGVRAAFDLGACSLFQCVKTVTPSWGKFRFMPSACFQGGGSKGQCLWLVPGCQALGSAKDPQGGGAGRWLLVVGPWAVAMAFREVEAAPRAFGRGSWRGVYIPRAGESNE